MAQLSIDELESDSLIPKPRQPEKGEDTGWSPGAKMLIGAGVTGASLAFPPVRRLLGKGKFAVPETENFAKTMRSYGIAPSVADLAPERGYMKNILPSEASAYRTPYSTLWQKRLENAGESTAVALRRRQRAQFEEAKARTLTGIEPPMYRPGSLGQEIRYRFDQEYKRRKDDVDAKWDDLRNTAATMSGYKKLSNVIPQRTAAAVKELLDTYPKTLGHIENAKVADALAFLAELDPKANLSQGIPFIYSPSIHGAKLPAGSRPASRAGFDDLRRHIGAAERALRGDPKTADQARLLGKIEDAIYDDLADWGAATGNKKVARLSTEARDAYKTQIVPYKELPEAKRLLYGEVPEEEIPGMVLRHPSIATQFVPLMGPGGAKVLGFGAAQRALGVPGSIAGERLPPLAKRMEAHDPLLQALLDPQDYQQVAPLGRIAATLPSTLPTDTVNTLPFTKNPLGSIASFVPGSSLMSKAAYSPLIQKMLFSETSPVVSGLGIAGGLGGAGLAGAGVVDWLGQMPRDE